MSATSKIVVKADKAKNRRTATRNSASQAKADARKDYLLDIAGQFFLEKGFEATSVGEIARRARASKETFYRHFPTKEDLFREVVQRGTVRMANELDLALLMGALPEEALSAFGIILLERLLSVDTVKLHRIMGMSQKMLPEQARVFYEQGPMRVQASLTSYLKDQQEQGRLRAADATVAARQFIDLVVSEQMFRSRLGIFPEPTPEERKATVRAAVDCFLNGYISAAN